MNPLKPRFSERFSLRVHLLLILCGVVGAGVLANWGLRRLGVGAMPVRYPLRERRWGVLCPFRTRG